MDRAPQALFVKMRGAEAGRPGMGETRQCAQASQNDRLTNAVVDRYHEFCAALDELYGTRASELAL